MSESYLTFDNILRQITDYVFDYEIVNPKAYELARFCLLDSYGCAIHALSNLECDRFIKSIIHLRTQEEGILIPGTHFKVDPYCASLGLGALIRWLDFNDTWLAAEWGHPSDNIAGIMVAAEYISKINIKNDLPPLKMDKVLEAIIKVYEIQGVLALENGFNKIGLDQVIFVKIASTAVLAKLLNGSKLSAIQALSHAFVDGQSLRTYRQFPNTQTRKSWAAGDAVSRAMWLAKICIDGEMGFPTALTAKRWGFNDVYLKGIPLIFNREFSTYVIENILFKIPYPTEFHAQTLVECMLQLRSSILPRLSEIKKIIIYTHEAAKLIIDKTGDLKNHSDRDHCLQYIGAFALLNGFINSDSYSDEQAQDPRIDLLRNLMEVNENVVFTRDYNDPAKRAVTNSVQILFKDGTKTDEIVVEYPIGHPKMRDHLNYQLSIKFRNNLLKRFSINKIETIMQKTSDIEKIKNLTVLGFTQMWHEKL